VLPRLPWSDKPGPPELSACCFAVSSVEVVTDFESDADGDDVSFCAVLSVFVEVSTGAGTVVTTTFAEGTESGAASWPVTAADAATSADESAVTDPAACVGGGAAASAAFAE